MTTHRTGTRDEWLAARLELLPGGEGAHPAQRRAGASGGRRCRGFGSTRRTGSTPTRGAPRWRTSSAGARSSSSTTSCSGPTTRPAARPARRSRTASTGGRAPGPPRRDALGGLAGAAREAPGVPAADGLDLPLGVLARAATSTPISTSRSRGGAAGGHRVQLPARARVANGGRREGAVSSRPWPGPTRPRTPARGRASARSCARTASSTTPIPPTRAGWTGSGACTSGWTAPQGTQRDGPLVAPSRRVRPALRARRGRR